MHHGQASGNPTWERDGGRGVPSIPRTASVEAAAAEPTAGESASVSAAPREPVASWLGWAPTTWRARSHR
ncbi:MAG: hypothetical protein ABMB14_02545 [Myxococcota bacterium]